MRRLVSCLPGRAHLGPAHCALDATPEASIAKAILSEPLVPTVKRRPDLPKALQVILDRALAKDRERRYPDCRAFQAELEAFIRSCGKPMSSSQLARFVAQVMGVETRGELMAAAHQG
jgi:serine/threonine-protein kinase